MNSQNTSAMEGSPRPGTAFVVSIDTEEDNWGWASSSPITCNNVEELGRLVRFCERLGIRPTFFVTYAVMRDDRARGLIRELASESTVEIGTHVHPWNTPPFSNRVDRRTMLYEYPLDLQRAKIASATDLIGDTIARQPTCFRAGRFGFGRLTAQLLVELGYSVDSSVTPYWDWRESSHGPTYIDAPDEIYRIKVGEGVLRHNPLGELTEVPVTAGFTRLPRSAWRGMARSLESPLGKAVHVGGIAARLLGARRVILSPEVHGSADMVALCRQALGSGVQHLHLFLHSPSLRPGLSPFTRTQSDVEELYSRLEELLGALRESHELRCSTVSEAPQLTARDRQSQIRDSANTSAQPRLVGEAPRGIGGWLRRRQYGGVREEIAYVARNLIWLLGGYRRYRLVRWSDVHRVVYVCSGNICRSTYAEGYSGRLALPAASVGTTTTPGGPADGMATAVAMSRGVDLERHRTTRLEDFNVQEGDLFVAMEPRHAKAVEQHIRAVPNFQLTLLGIWIPGHGPVLPDPFDRGEECFFDCFLRIEAGVAELAKRLAGTRDGSET